MVLFIGFLLLVSLVLSAGLSAMGEVMGSFMTEKLHILQIVNTIVSLGVVTVLFAMTSPPPCYSWVGRKRRNR